MAKVNQATSGGYEHQHTIFFYRKAFKIIFMSESKMAKGPYWGPTYLISFQLDCYMMLVNCMKSVFISLAPLQSPKISDAARLGSLERREGDGGSAGQGSLPPRSAWGHRMSCALNISNASNNNECHSCNKLIYLSTVLIQLIVVSMKKCCTQTYV